MRSVRHRQNWGFVAALALPPAVVAAGFVLALTAGQQSASATPGVTDHGHTRARELRAAVPAPQPLDSQAPPVRVAVPSVGIHASIVPTGAEANEIVVPPVARVGWFDGGPRPGEPGRTILIAHIDSLDGPAAFTGLPDVAEGASVTVVSADGTRSRYRMSRTLEVPKLDFPADRVYAPTAGSTLVLITCTGAFDPDRGYEDNFIAFARPA